jgi:hypothetical protein
MRHVMNVLPIDDFCTLPTAAQPKRLMEFDELFRHQLDPPRRLGRHRVEFTFAGMEGRYAEVSDLVARESACCSFFEFDVEQRVGPEVNQEQLLLRVGVPASRDDVLDALMDRALAALRLGY